MALLRRQFLQLAAAMTVLPAASRFGSAQSYPTRPVRIVVGFPPGGNADLVARLMGQWLSERLGQTFIVENRPGANTNLATEAVVRAPADGHTLLLVGPPQVTNMTLYEKLNYNFIQDIVPVASILRTPFVMEVTPSLPVKSVPELIAYAKANPGKLNIGSAGIGSGPHLAGELFKMMAGVDMLHIPYRGTGPGLTALLGEQVQVYFDGIPTSIEHIKAGKLRPLAVTSETPSAVLPDIPPLSDFLPGYEASLWFGIGAPRNTPVEFVSTLSKEINAALADAKMKARLADMGASVLPGSPADFGKLLADESDKWGKVVKFAGAKLD